MDSEIKKKLAIFTLCLFFAMPLFQMANTFFLNQGVVFSNIGQIYTIVLLALLFYFSPAKIKNIYIVIGLAGVAFILLHKLNLRSLQPVSAIIIDCIQVVKLTAVGLFVSGLTVIIALLDLSSQKVLQVLRIALYVTVAIFVANIFLGMAGFGDAQYRLGFGYKGFFYSGNEFAVSFVVSAFALLYVLYTLKHKTEAFIVSVGLMIIGPIQGMKTVILGLFIAALLAPLAYLLTTKGRQIISKKLLFILGGIIGCAAGFAIVIALLFPTNPFFVRFQEIYARGGLISAITGERNQTVAHALTVYTDQFSFTQKMIGVGKTRTEQLVGQFYKYGTKAIEVDPVDLLLQFGLIGFLVFYGIWLTVILRCFKDRNYSALGINLLLFALSSLSGHIIFSAFVAIYWSLSFLLKPRNQNKSLPTVVFLGATEKGGIGTYMQLTAKHLNMANFSVVMIQTQTGQLLKTFFLFPIAIIKMKLAVLNSYVSGVPVIFHYHMATKGSFVRKFIFAILFRPFVDKQVLHLHGAKSSQFFEQLLRIPGSPLLLSFFFSLFDHIILVSKTLKSETQNVLQHHNVNYYSKRWTVLYNAIELPTKSIPVQPFKKGDVFNMLFVGRLVEQKNLPLLLTIADMLHKKNVSFHLTIAGDGPDMTDTKNRITKLKLQKHVSLIGWVDHEKVDTLYQRNHLFIITSRFESFGIVVLEAYKNGLPALTTKIGGLQDIVTKDTGFLFNPDNPEKAVDWVIDKIKHPAEFAKLQQLVQQYVKEFSYDAHIEELTALYTNTLRN